MAIDPKVLVVKPVNELVEVTGLQPGSMLFYDGSDNLKRISIDTFNNIAKSAIPLKITDPSPNIDGLYIPTTSGTYTNAGGLIAQAGYYTLFFKNGSTWTKSETKITGQFKGVAIPSTSPISPSDGDFYLTSTSGTYTNFNSISVSETITALIYSTSNSSWRKEIVYDFSNVVEEVVGKNKFNKNDLLLGYLASDSGSLVNDTDSYVSNYIEVLPSTNYYLSGRNLAGTKAIVFYDINKTKLPPIGTTYEDVPLNGAISTPSNAYYVRMTVIFNSSGSTNSIQLEIGNSATSYSAYSKVIPNYYTSSMVDSLLANLNISPSQTTFFEKRKNLFDKDTMVFYDNLINNSNGAVTPATGWAYMQVPVNPLGLNIVINKGLSNVSTSDDVIHFFNSSDVRVGTTNNLTAPIPSDTAYIRMNISNLASNWDFARKSVLVEYGTVSGEYIPYTTTDYIKTQYLPSQNLKTKGKLITFVGDSIVKAQGYKGWLSLLENDLGVATVNKGENGATITDIYPSASTISGSLLTYQYNFNTKLTIFSAGTNDFANNLPLGTDADRDTRNASTVKGSLYKAIKWVQDNNPSSKILVMTPLERSTNNTNTLGFKLKDYRDAIINVCEYYNIPYLDMMYNNLLSTPTAYKYLYDGLHPNNEGYLASFNVLKNKVIELFQ